MKSQAVLKQERSRPHFEHTRATWQELQTHLNSNSLSIDGQSLSIAGVSAVARHNCSLEIDKRPAIVQDIEQSVHTLNKFLDDGSFLYGVNTGFGGSADVRTRNLPGLQVSLMQHTQSAVIPRHDLDGSTHAELGSHLLPSTWVKASMLVRVNSNIRGHSAITLSLAESLVELVRNDCTPLVPLRGSVSASGDLMPMAYIGGAVMGSPDIRIRMGPKYGHRVVPADEALRILNIQPIVLGPKEGLALINGTAPSAAVASLAMYDANNLAVLSQMLTGMTSEALAGSAEYTHEFIHDVRPHSGQIETASNLRKFLSGSKLVSGLHNDENRFSEGLAQPRYATRSAPQWVSPILEDFLLASNQISTELNSTSDNPVINVQQNDVHCGANFQASVVASAAEKTRSGLQLLGKMLFAQTSELINNTLNNGLPPNLASDDPSLSFCLKGIDVNMAAYQSELAFLSHSVSAHVQSAEMHNQAINSLALISSRYTMQAVELVSLMSASALYTACQALDLRVLHITFLESFQPTFFALSKELLAGNMKELEFRGVWEGLVKAWYANAGLDAKERCGSTAATTIARMLGFPSASAKTFAHGSKYCQRVGDEMLQQYIRHRDAFFKYQTTAKYLGTGSRLCYDFVRRELRVPFHRGLVEQPSPSDPDENMIDSRRKRTVGSWVSHIYDAIRDGRMTDRMMSEQVVNGAEVTNGTSGTAKIV